MKVYRLNHDPMPPGDFITLKLSPGIWQWHFRDKKTLQPLTLNNKIELLEETQVAFEIPENISKNENVTIKIDRVR